MTVQILSIDRGAVGDLWILAQFDYGSPKWLAFHPAHIFEAIGYTALNPLTQTA